MNVRGTNPKLRRTEDEQIGDREMETGKGEAQGAYGEQAIAVSCEEPQLKSASGDSKLYLRHLRVQVWLRGCCHHLSQQRMGQQ